MTAVAGVPVAAAAATISGSSVFANLITRDLSVG
jgi:hypothetical protein